MHLCMYPAVLNCPRPVGNESIVVWYFLPSHEAFEASYMPMHYTVQKTFNTMDHKHFSHLQFSSGSYMDFF